jgi:hypothetical protein
MIGNLGPARMQEFGLQREDQLFDPVTNAKAAYAIRKSQGLSAWTIYKNGAYKNHLSAAEAAKNAPSLRTSPSFGSMELGKGYGTEGSKIAGELGRFIEEKRCCSWIVFIDIQNTRHIVYPLVIVEIHYTIKEEQ